jgi:hypothetical protein
MANIVRIQIFAEPDRPDPTLSVPDVPWFAGITVLQAMIIGEALSPKNFVFRVEYRSIYGAQIDSIDNVTDNITKPSHYWMLYINGEEATVGASEAILLEDAANHVATVDWRYLDTSSGQHAQLALKTNPIS